LSFSIEQAKQHALENNPEYHIQLKKLKAQKGQYWSDIMPEDAEIGVEYEGIPESENYSKYDEKRLFVTQTLDFPTNYYFKHKLLRSEIQKQQAQLEKTRRTILFHLKEAYWKLVMTQEQVKLAKQNVQLSEDFYKRAAKSYELGETDKLTMLKAKVNLGASQTNLRNTLKDVEVSNSYLKEILGIDRPVQIIVADTLSKAIDVLQRKQTNNALGQHPDMIMAEIEQKAASSDKWLAYSSFLPSISATYFKQEIAKEKYWGGEIGFSIPLWFPGKAGLVSQKKAELSMAVYNMSAQKLQLQREYDQAFALLEKAADEVNLYQSELLKEAEEVFRIAQKSYAVGEIGYLDYIDAQKLLIETQERYVAVLFQYHVERANLKQLTGIET
jgi:outer membrane protein TolC